VTGTQALADRGVPAGRGGERRMPGRPDLAELLRQFPPRAATQLGCHRADLGPGIGSAARLDADGAEILCRTSAILQSADRSSFAIASGDNVGDALLTANELFAALNLQIDQCSGAHR
jgi:hypothetical protein